MASAISYLNDPDFKKLSPAAKRMVMESDAGFKQLSWPAQGEILKRIGADRDVSQRAQENLGRIAAGDDLPPGYTKADMADGDTTNFLREIGVPTSVGEFIGAGVRAGVQAGRTGFDAAKSTVRDGGRMVAGSVMPPTAIGQQFNPSYTNPGENAIGGILNGQAAEARKAGELFDQAPGFMLDPNGDVAFDGNGDAGAMMKGVGHAIASVTPLAGPFAADVGEDLMTPRTPVAIGKIVGAVAGGKAMGSAVDAVKGIPATREALTVDAPAKLMNSGLPAQMKYYAFGRNPGRALVKAGVKTLAEAPELLYTRIMQPVHNALQELLNTPAAQTKIINVKAAIQSVFGDALSTAMRRKDTSVIDRLESVRDSYLNDVMDGTNHTGWASPAVANEIKRSLGDAVTEWTEDAVEGKLNDALTHSYTLINRLISEAVPGAKRLNDLYADAITAKSAARAALKREQMGGAMVRKLTGLYSLPAAAALALSGHPVAGAVALTGLLGRSFSAKSALARGLDKMAPEEAPIPPTTPDPIATDNSFGPPEGGANQPVFASGEDYRQAPLPMNMEAETAAGFGMRDVDAATQQQIARMARLGISDSTLRGMQQQMEPGGPMQGVGDLAGITLPEGDAIGAHSSRGRIVRGGGTIPQPNNLEFLRQYAAVLQHFGGDAEKARLYMELVAQQQ